MINLVKLTTIENLPIYVNPTHITMFTPGTEGFCKALGADPSNLVKGSTTLLINGMPLQIKDSPKDIISAMIRLRDQNARYLRGFKKEIEREEWQDDNEEEEEIDD